jgi:hypothetical protein
MGYPYRKCHRSYGKAIEETQHNPILFPGFSIFSVGRPAPHGSSLRKGVSVRTTRVDSMVALRYE